MVKIKGLSKQTLERLKKKGIKVEAAEGSAVSGAAKKTAAPVEARKQGSLSGKKEAANEGEVKVISFDRIVLSKKWTSRLGLKQGDALKIKFENGSLVLKK